MKTKDRLSGWTLIPLALGAVVISVGRGGSVDASDGLQAEAALAAVCARPGVTPVQAADDGPEPPDARRVSSLVIAGLPTALGRRMESLADHIGRALGVDMAPDWFNLDMAAFVAATPISAADAARKLGLVVISNVSEDLLLAPVDTEETRAAEARLFLLRLFRYRDGKEGRDAPRLMWRRAERYFDLTMAYRFRARYFDEMTDEKPLDHFEDMDEIIGEVDGEFNVMEPYGLAEEAEREAGELADDFERLEEEDLLRLEGPLNDPAVARALGLDPGELRRPTRHFSVDELRVAPSQSVQRGRAYTYHYPDIVDSDLKLLVGSRFRNDGVMISLAQPNAAPYLPTGPFVDPILFAGEFARVWRAALDRPPAFTGPVDCYAIPLDFSMGDEYAPDAEFTFSRSVCLRLEDFRQIKEPDAAALAAHARTIVKLTNADADDEKIWKVEKRALLELHLTHAPSNMVWADAYAARTIVGLRDDIEWIDDARLAIIDTLRKALAKLAQEGDEEALPLGAFDDALFEAYGIAGKATLRWGPYRPAMLELQRDGTPSYAGYLIIQTLDGAPEALRFAARIAPDGREFEWLAGRPESVDEARAQGEELRRGVELMLRALRADADSGGLHDLDGYDESWVASVFEHGDFQPARVGKLAFSVRRGIVPGYWRAAGEVPGRFGLQAAQVDTDDGSWFWETRHPRDTPGDELKIPETDIEEPEDE